MPLLRVNTQITTQLRHMARRTHIVLSHRNNTPLINHKRRTNQTLVHPAVILLLTPCTIRLGNRMISIR